MPDYSAKQIVKIFESLKTERATLENHCQEIADYMIPRRGDITTTHTAGEKLNRLIVDNTGMIALELLAGALHGMLTNPNSLWFELTTGDTKLDNLDNVRKWLYNSTVQMHNTMNNSNFQTEVHEYYIDNVAFGTSCMTIEEDDSVIVRFGTRHFNEYMIKENNKGFVDEIYRRWKWDAINIVREYGEGEAKVGRKVWEAYQKNRSEKFEIVQCVYPKPLDVVSPFEFLTKHVLVCDGHELKSGGFMEFPYVVSRWLKKSGEVYGRSPAMNALPEVKTINAMAETMIKGAQKVADPPLQLPDDGFIMPIKTRPGGLNYYRAGTADRIQPIFNDSRIDFGFEAMKERRERIREAFFVDQLQTVQGPQMTATEYLGRLEEKMRLMGPILGRQQSEFLRPLIDRTFGIMLRRDMFGEIPRELRGRKIDVQYSSMIARTQRINEGQNILRFIQSVVPFIQLDPKIGDLLNGDQMALHLARVYSLPQEGIRDQREVRQIREARDQAQQESLAKQEQARQADIMSKTGPAVAQLQQAQAEQAQAI